eukprot:7140312-Pyramimonas_sp.AAC.1
MDRWLAMDDLSQGLRDETARVTFRDRATDSLAAQGARDKLAAHACNFLIYIRTRGEKLECCYTDGAGEFAQACPELEVARHPAVPGNKKLMAVAE